MIKIWPLAYFPYHIIRIKWYWKDYSQRFYISFEIARLLSLSIKVFKTGFSSGSNIKSSLIVFGHSVCDRTNEDFTCGNLFFMCKPITYTTQKRIREREDMFQWSLNAFSAIYYIALQNVIFFLIHMFKKFKLTQTSNLVPQNSGV